MICFNFIYRQNFLIISVPVLSLFEKTKTAQPAWLSRFFMQLGTPSGNRTHIYPLGGDCSIHLTIGAYIIRIKLVLLIPTHKFYYNYLILSNL